MVVNEEREPKEKEENQDRKQKEEENLERKQKEKSDKIIKNKLIIFNKY